MTAQIATASASQKFWDRIAPKYSRQPIKNMEAYEAMRRMVERGYLQYHKTLPK